MLQKVGLHQWFLGAGGDPLHRHELEVFSIRIAQLFTKNRQNVH